MSTRELPLSMKPIVWTQINAENTDQQTEPAVLPL